MNFFSNAGGIVSSNIFLQQFAPKYTQPLTISAAIAGFGMVYIGCMRIYMVLFNRRRNKAQGVNWTSKDVSTAELADGRKSPKYRYFL